MKFASSSTPWVTSGGIGGFECAVSHEHDNVVHIFRVNTDELTQCSDMNFVLLEWVLETIPEFVNYLRPSGIVRIAKYPAVHVLRLYDEYPIWRNDHVIDLCGHVTDW